MRIEITQGNDKIIIDTGSVQLSIEEVRYQITKAVKVLTDKSKK